MRAVGVNVVLAHAGAPVCAEAMQLPLVALHTSMRVADSLERGLSLFMASLVRLERIVRAAREASQARPVCYLLDEVLQGTNSAERRVAVRTIVDHLLASWASAWSRRTTWIWRAIRRSRRTPTACTCRRRWPGRATR